MRNLSPHLLRPCYQDVSTNTTFFSNDTRNNSNIIFILIPAESVESTGSLECYSDIFSLIRRHRYGRNLFLGCESCCNISRNLNIFKIANPDSEPDLCVLDVSDFLDIRFISFFL